MVFSFGAAASSGLPVSFLVVYAVGFIAAVTIGSIAWYNSKRPPGWEDKEKPGFIPEVS
ncbi:MAG: photosystem II assembly protein Psb35, partial [Synechococcales cyanobacterium]